MAGSSVPTSSNSIPSSDPLFYLNSDFPKRSSILTWDSWYGNSRHNSIFLLGVLSGGLRHPHRTGNPPVSGNSDTTIHGIERPIVNVGDAEAAGGEPKASPATSSLQVG